MVEEKPLNTGKSCRSCLIKMGRRPHDGARLDSSRGETQAALVAQLGTKWACTSFREFATRNMAVTID